MKAYNKDVIRIILLLFAASWFFGEFCFAQEVKEKFFEIKAKKFSYTPNIIKVNKGDKVKIRLISEDVTHGLYIDGYNLETRANPGQDGSISFTADKPGKFSFRCSVTCGEFHPYMIGYLIISPNYRFHLFIIITVIFALGCILVIFLKKAG